MSGLGVIAVVVATLLITISAGTYIAVTSIRSRGLD
jgi:hypothetical protein